MTDNELRQRLEQGHVAAFGWALACCRGNRDDAEDVLHDSYLAVLNGGARFDAQSSFQTWLFGVIRLKAASARRRAWLRNLILEKKNGALRHDPVQLPDSEAEAQSRSQHLRSLVNTLSDRQRQVLHLVFYQAMTVESAAHVMGVSVGAARTHYARGKEKLGRMLNGVKEL
jgi:RNA polymerase sigma-70 factor (ECF subfamily)